MRKVIQICGISLAVFLPILIAVPANAQATRTWVSGVGDDANPCSRTAPCKTFAGAISKTAPGGEIDALDPGGFGGVTITKALTIAAEGAGEAGILVAGTNGITVSAGVNDIVVLRGLQIDGGPVSSNSLNGVKFNSGAALIVQNCAIRNFTGAAPNGYGIFFAPTTAASLFVSDTVLSNNGASTGGGGIIVQPMGTGSAKARVVRVNSINNVFGFRADGNDTNGTVSMVVSDSTATGNAFGGITAFTPSGGPVVRAIVSNSIVADNGVGLNANGASAILRIGTSVVTGNATGATISNGATMTSLGNNLINDNAIPGATLPISGPA